MCEEEEEGRPGRGEKSTADFSKALLCKAVWLEEVVEVEVGGGVCREKENFAIRGDC